MFDHKLKIDIPLHTPVKFIKMRYNRVFITRTCFPDVFDEVFLRKQNIPRCDAAECGSTSGTLFYFIFFFFFFFFELGLNVPVNKFSVISGRSQRFLGLTSTEGS